MLYKSRILRQISALAALSMVLLLPGCGTNQSGRLLELASAGHLAGIKHKLIEGADPAAIDKEGRNLMMRAAYNGHDPVVAYTLDLGVNPINHQDHNGWTAVMCAAAKGHEAVVRRLLGAGANPNLSTIKGNTALMWATQNGHSDVVDMLLEAGANKDKRNFLDWTAADIADRAGYSKLKEKLETPINSQR